MQFSKLTLMVSLAGAAALQLHAQPASPELQGKALELLRQTIQQERQQGPMASPAVGQPMPASQQQRALDLLRQEVAKERASSAAAATSKKARSSSAAAAPGKRSGSSSASTAKKPAAHKPPSSSNTPAVSQSAAPSAPAVSTAPAIPSPISKSKQDRLQELLEQYRADKLTPSEYHAARAKILAEP